MESTDVGPKCRHIMGIRNTARRHARENATIWAVRLAFWMHHYVFVNIIIIIIVQQAIGSLRFGLPKINNWSKWNSSFHHSGCQVREDASLIHPPSVPRSVPTHTCETESLFCVDGRLRNTFPSHAFSGLPMHWYTGIIINNKYYKHRNQKQAIKTIKASIYERH